MSEFARRLAAANARLPRTQRRWIYVPYDQLSDEIGPLAEHPVHELGIVMVENPGKAARRPYHKQKLALLLANGRQFALEQAARGRAVRFVVAGNDGYAGRLARLAEELGPLTMMVPAERELRRELAPLRKAGALKLVRHEGWLSTREDFRSACPAPPYRMEAFYRYVRKKTGWLMEGGKPLGGKWSHDADNRKPWRGTPPAPLYPTFEPDAITREVVALVETHFAHHPGTLDAGALPTTLADAERLWSWAKEECLRHFGPYEDAMSARSSGLFHTRISGLVNLHRLLPRRVLEDALALALPLASKEGFVRQILGWREYVHHVHIATDGFRVLPGGAPELLSAPGDGGYERWAGQPWPAAQGGDGGAAPSLLNAQEGVPPAYWGAPSGLRCLDEVIRHVWSEGYSHHITRLMVLSNLAMLIGVSPRELTDWFWAAYVDAYDWVVEPNVLAMGTFGTGPLITTKPYVAGAAYIDRMSDFCKGCRFDPKRNCPIGPLYWAFLAQHRELLASVPRMDMPLRTLQKRAPEARARDLRVLDWVQSTLRDGHELKPEQLPE